MIPIAKHTNQEQLSETEFRVTTSQMIHNVFKHGKWHPANRELILSGKEYETSCTKYSLKIDPNIVGYTSIVDGEENSCRLVEINDSSFNPNINYEVIGNQFIWHDVVPNLDVMIYADNERVLFFKILKNELAPTRFKMAISGKADWFSDDPQGRDSFYADDEFKISEYRNTNPAKTSAEREDGYLIHTFLGEVVKKHKDTRIKYSSKEITYPVGLHTLWSYQLAAADYADDGWQTNGGNFYDGQTGYTYLQIGSQNGKTREGGWHFDSVNVPQGATITDATLKLKTTSVAPSTTDVKFYGNDVDNAPAWGVTTNKPTDITKTTAYTGVVGFTASAVNNVDVTAIAQEIVDRAGWVANYSMAFTAFNNHCLGYSSPCSGDHRTRIYQARETYGTPANFPELVINYTVGGGATIPVLSYHHYHNTGSNL